MSSSNKAIGHHDAANHYWKESNDDDESSSSCLFVFQLAHGMALPMALKAAIELGILELIKEAGPGSFVSSAELAARTAPTNPEASAMIDRILRLLAGCRILNCKLFGGDGDGTVERRYSLGPVCRFLTKNDDGVSMAPLFLMCNDKVHLESWYHLKEAVLEGGVPFEKAHGMSPFEHTRKDPNLNKMFNLGMSNVSTIIVKKILDVYDGFEGLDSVVDVGGGTGAIIEAIVSKYPTIRGVNFDLPHVIRDAPQHSRVENIGGDMFVSVPEADAIFMKNILHDWSDEHCVKILKNCRKALRSSDDGKVIVAERILSETPGTGLEAVDLYADVIMMAHTRGGRERTEKEFHALAEQAGFTKFCKVCLAYYMWIMEFIK